MQSAVFSVVLVFGREVCRGREEAVRLSVSSMIVIEDTSWLN